MTVPEVGDHEDRAFIGAQFQRDQFGLVLRMEHYHGDHLRYDKERDQPHNWDGRRWNPSTDADLKKIAWDVIDRLPAEAATLSSDAAAPAREGANTGPSPRTLHLKFAASVRNDKSIKAMLSLFRARERLWIDGDRFDTNPYLWNFLNGTVDIRTMKLKDHDPADLITKLIPHDYNPEATAPKWERLVLRCFKGAVEMPDPELPAFVQKLQGYTFLGRNDEQKIVFVGVDENSGKTKLIEIPAEVLGPDYAHKAKTELISRQRNGRHDSQWFSIRGKHYVYISETSSVFNLDEQGVKELTGDRRLTTRKMYTGRERNDRVTWTIWAGVNAYPNVLEWDGAVQRRVICLPAGPTIPESEVDKTLDQQILDEEAEGVLAYLVRGANRWHADYETSKNTPGVENTGLALPPSVAATTAEYARSQDHVGQFVTECLAANEAARVPKPMVHETFKKWRGIGETSSRNKLYKAVNAAFASSPGFWSDSRFFYGIELVDELTGRREFGKRLVSEL